MHISQSDLYLLFTTSNQFAPPLSHLWSFCLGLIQLSTICQDKSGIIKIVWRDNTYVSFPFLCYNGLPSSLETILPRVSIEFISVNSDFQGLQFPYLRGAKYHSRNVNDQFLTNQFLLGKKRPHVPSQKTADCNLNTIIHSASTYI